MATNYALENGIIALASRADELKGNIENDSPDLADTADELTWLSDRAATLRDAAHGIDNILSEL